MRLALIGVLAGHWHGRGANRADRFVGLAAPHLVRSMAKSPRAWLVLLASLMGGLLLMGADVLAAGHRARKSCRWACSPPCWAAATCCG